LIYGDDANHGARLKFLINGHDTLDICDRLNIQHFCYDLDRILIDKGFSIQAYSSFEFKRFQDLLHRLDLKICHY